jgi:hypothetical protein
MPIVHSETNRQPTRYYDRIFIPRNTVISAWEFLRSNGARGHEQLCFLAGRAVGDDNLFSAQVTSCVQPLTDSSAGYVTLTSYAQTAVVLDALERRGEVPLMSLHTHGDGGAFGSGPQHSSVDDHGVALTPENGVFSGILPYYAQGSPFDFVRQLSLYERVEGKWERLSSSSKERRVVVHDDVVRIVPSLPERRN